jgi:hypothetical protein
MNSRIISVPYLVYRRVLNRDDLGLIIDAKSYYNLVRNQRGNKEKDTTISGLLVVFNLADFHYRTRVEDLLNDLGIIISRKLLQIWFIHPEAIRIV